MTSSPPITRLARIEDAGNMRSLMRRAVFELGKGFYTEQQVQSAAEYLCVPDPALIEDGTSYVIESDGELIAVGAWSTRQKLYSGSEEQEFLVDRVIPGLDAARIRAFFVHPTHAKRGLATLLYQTCEDAAREMGFTEFELVATMPGVPFYEKMGFVGMGVIEIELLDGTLLPCQPMSKSLY